MRCSGSTSGSWPPYSGLSVPTIQRMEASEDVIRGNVNSLTKLIGALERCGVELIGDGAVSPTGGRGVRLRLSARDIEIARARTRTPPDLGAT